MQKRPDLVEETRDHPRVAQPDDGPALRPSQDVTADSGDALWNVVDVSTYLQLPVSSIYKMTARRATARIPHIRIGSKLRFRRADIDRWLTLLTHSNLEALSKMRQKVSKVTHGNDSQTETSRW